MKSEKRKKKKKKKQEEKEKRTTERLALLGEKALESPEMREAAELAGRAAEGCVRAGRPLYAANADLPVPTAPHLALWHAATLLREHRGDVHLVALQHEWPYCERIARGVTGGDRRRGRSTPP